MIKPMLTAAALTAALTTVGSPATAAAPMPTTSPFCQSGKTVRFAEITWESGQFITEVMRHILEKGYGCKTRAVPGSSTITETALANGDLEVWAEEWEGLYDVTNKAVASGKATLVGKVLGGGAFEGWFVPDYVVKGDAKRGIKPMAPGLKSVYDLPKYKALFKDEENPRKSRLYGCFPGWACQKTNWGKLRAYKLNDFVQFNPGSQAALDASVASAYKRGEPILFYYWGPTSLLGKYNFIQLEDPKYNKACYDLVRENSPKSCPSGSPVTTLRVNLNTAFMKQAPVLTGFFERTQFTLPQLQGMLARMIDERMKPDAAAREYLKKYPDTWTKWVPAEVATKVQASLK
ncbi:ABC transporter substrate-binding protein [Deinococcus fonticola]|uniref:ABC transporter substrate-binding protein n=1 Tax=Deinococcus fonticola TaxID=2528713 RepID=UPI00197AF034|nr:ABC transporter substrate-binding protein [Deinococcus fonticola]